MDLNESVPQSLRVTAQSQHEHEEAVLPIQMLPSLLGRHTRKWSRSTSLRKRIQSLLSLAREIVQEPRTDLPNCGPCRKTIRPPFTRRLAEINSRLVLGVLLFLVIYVKFYAALAFSPSP